jgi:hypothetical protein
VPQQVHIPAPDPAVGDLVPPAPDGWSPEHGPEPPPAAALVPAPARPAAPVPVPVPAHGPPPRRPGPQHRPDPRPRRGIDRRRLAVVYDVEGPRVRLGVAWFAVAIAATLIHPVTAALVYGVAAGMAGRQIAKAWGAVQWQADMAAGLAGVPVLAALGGTPLLVGSLALGAVVAAGASLAPDGARLAGPGGRVAAAGILWLTLVPAIGAASVVLVRSASTGSAIILVLLASAYEVGDYIVGSGASNPVEGPLAGITTATLIAVPLAMIEAEPFTSSGLALVGFAAVAYPFGQILASALLPGAGAHAPALRRIDTLLLLAPLWAAATGAF